MAEQLKPDICVIGAGSGGLSIAAGASQFGLSVVVVERGRMGGDCLNFGCVPSKALIAAARRKHAIETAAPFGIEASAPRVVFAAVNAHVRGVIDAIAPNDSVERFTAMGVRVVQRAGKFRDPRTLVAGDVEIKARKFVIATGSSPAVPPIPGLAETPYFTNETLFENTELPRHLIIIGGGPIGLEMAQAHRRLGARVTVVEAMTPFARDDPELAGFVLAQLETDGVRILSGATVSAVAATKAGVAVTVKTEAEKNGAGKTEKGEIDLRGSHLLVATGRAANVNNLGLEAAGVTFDRRGIKVNKRLKTSNSRIYAIGDVTGGLQFTHAANYHAGLVLRHIMFRLPVKVREDCIPWVTYTDPELAWVGLGEEAAKKAHGNIRILRWPFGENDRAQAERQTAGLVKVITTTKGKVLGAGIAGANAGEFIGPWVRAVTFGEKVSALTGPIVPYPTIAEINKRVAYTYYTPLLEHSRLPGIARWIARHF
ncbi:Mercuric ion reductase [hydrothermal vent metagenome]|uniref:Mercuric ion reductase n=1 Tax=hydrothermal vent metagenome TaxID=652676 RepID=A0A3B0TV20_9ZZZZ